MNIPNVIMKLWTNDRLKLLDSIKMFLINIIVIIKAIY